ncbi:putative bifunctional diguanylate cyclase/phosphodiesterase [Geodermatophilus sp. SYSU D00079]
MTGRRDPWPGQDHGAGTGAARYVDVVLSPTGTTLGSSVYEALFTHGVDGVLITSADGRTLGANTRACELLGAGELDLVRAGRDGVVDTRDGRWAHAVQTRAREGSFRGVVPMRRSDGTTFPAEITTALFRDGNAPRAYVAFRDTTAAESEAARTAESRRAAAEVVDSLESFSDMYVGTDADWRVTYINAQAELRLGVSRRDVVGGDLWEEFPALVGTAFEEAYRRAARTGRPTTVEGHYPAADLWCEARAYPLRRGGIGIYFRDTADRREMELERERLLAAERAARAEAEAAQRHLAHRATHDELTGLLNRAGLVQEVDRVLAARPGVGVTVLFIDLDRFKLVNDSLGHALGDRLLVAFGRRLADLAGPGDLVARFGGDEFVVALVDAGCEAAGRLAEAVVAASREPVHVGARLLVTASVGLAAAADRADLPRLLRDADAALYAAKDAGRERVAWFDEQLHTRSVQRVRLEQDLRQGLDRDELFVEYQPAFDLASGQIAHVEALVRWQHPVRGRVAPGDFIPVAEESGLIDRVGEWVLARAVGQAAAWAHPPGTRVWVNVSPRQLADAGFVPQLTGHLRRAGLPADRFGIEVTESTLGDRARLLEALAAVRALGVAIAIDDFGTGYSSLARLGAFPVDVIKIDRSFVADLGSARGEAVLAGIVTLAHAIGAHVIAEGVETPEQLASLRTLGADSASGFLLARPAAPGQLPDRLPAGT